MKIVSTGDWHFGKSNGSEQHNKDLLHFIEFMGEECRKRQCTTFVHCGDYFDRRDKIDIPSLNYGLRGMDALGKYFNEIYLLKGNHDITLKNSREISSLNIFRNGGVTLVEDYHSIGKDILLVSWLPSQEEFDNIVNISKKFKYVFGHFEFSAFRLNDNYVMEHGYSHREFSHLDKLISGHYHTKQIKDNVIYNGSPFPFDYGNANEFDHGFSILDTETGEVEFIIYDKINILSLTPTQVMELDIDSLGENTSIRVVMGDDTADNDLDAIREHLSTKSLRDVKIVYAPRKTMEDPTTMNLDNTEVLTIDQTVLKHLAGMAGVKGIDAQILLDIYNSACNDGQ